MKRDLDLIRDIMRRIEDSPAGGVMQLSSFSFDTHDEATVLEHLELLVDAGLINAKMITNMSGLAGVIAKGLTWQGHEFICAAKNDTLWSKAQNKFLNGTASFTFDVIKEWLVAQIT